MGAIYFLFTVRSSSSRLGQLPERTGGRAGGQASGRAGRGTSRAHDAAEGPTWRSPGARRGTERDCGPARSPKSPRRRGRGSATAHHVPGPRWRLKAALLGAPGRRAGGRARGRRQLTGGTAGRSSRRSWNRSGQDRGAPRRQGNGRAEPGLPLSAAPPATVPRALERGGELRGAPTWGLAGSRCFGKL